jgi:TRAP-type mannitol/chloroaromatic compound transport system permease small subunit
MAEQSPGLIKTVRRIDRFTDTTGVWISWLNLPLVAAVSYEVIARYLFDAPTIWSFDVTYMLYGTIFMLGAAYALHKGAHIRTDFFYEKWSDKTKGMVDSISYIVFFFPQIVNRRNLPPSRLTITRTRSLSLSTFSSVTSGLMRKTVSYSRSILAAGVAASAM